MELTQIIPPFVALGTSQSGHLDDRSDVDYYVIQIPAGGHLTLTLDDLDDLGANEVYIKHGSLPTAGDYDYKFSDFGSADQRIYVSGATSGDLDGNASAGGFDWFLSKYQPDGAKQWTIQLGTAQADFPRGVTLDIGDNLYLTGMARLGLNGNQHAGADDLVVLRLCAM